MIKIKYKNSVKAVIKKLVTAFFAFMERRMKMYRIRTPTKLLDKMSKSY